MNVDISDHAVIRYADRDSDPHYCKKAVRKEMQGIIQGSRPRDFNGNKMYLEGSGWVFVLDTDKSEIITCWRDNLG